MVESDGPVLTQELNNVWNDALLESGSETVEVVLVQANEAPQTLKHNLFAAHVGHRVDDANAVEGKLDEVTFA